MPFIESFPGHYFVQVIVYSLVAVAGIELLLTIGRIGGPLAQARLRFLGLLLPLLCPLVFLVYPARNGVYFREQIAAIDIYTWLDMGGGTVGWALFGLLVITIIVFVFREVVPLIKNRHSGDEPYPRIEKGRFPKLDEAVAALPEDTDGAAFDILLSPEKSPVVYRSGRDRLVISAALIDLLDGEELLAIIGHEVAHHSRQIVRLNDLLSVLRWLHFFNPVAYLIFSRIMKDIEKMCDDTAVTISGSRLPLVSALIKVHRLTNGNGRSDRLRQLWRGRFEETANRSLVKERVRRLMQESPADIPYRNVRLGFTALALAALLFFIV